MYLTGRCAGGLLSPIALDQIQVRCRTARGVDSRQIYSPTIALSLANGRVKVHIKDRIYSHPFSSRHA